MQKIHVPVNDAYDVLVEHGLLHRCGEIIKDRISAETCVIITDDNVDKYYSGIVNQSLQANGFRTVKFVFPHGEISKNAETLLKIYSFLCQNEITRSDCLIALGGGVVGDITGFAAATFLRGLPYVQIPTSLLAQVDSSVGGKTAVSILSEQAGDIVDLVYDLQEILVGFIFLRKVCHRHLVIRHLCDPFLMLCEVYRSYFDYIGWSPVFQYAK